MSEFIYWFEKQPEKINIIAVLISLFLTAVASISTWRLVSMEADKKKDEEKKFLNILLAEFKTNTMTLEYLKKSTADITKNQVELALKFKNFVFIPFREDGFNAFRDQGGFRYVDRELYSNIQKYYTFLNTINIKLDKFDRDEWKTKGLDPFYEKYITEEIIEEIESIESLNITLTNKLESLVNYIQKS